MNFSNKDLEKRAWKARAFSIKAIGNPPCEKCGFYHIDGVPSELFCNPKTILENIIETNIKYDHDSDIGKYKENCSQCWKYIHRGWDKCGSCNKVLEKMECVK